MRPRATRQFLVHIDADLIRRVKITRDRSQRDRIKTGAGSAVQLSVGRRRDVRPPPCLATRREALDRPGGSTIDGYAHADDGWVRKAASRTATDPGTAATAGTQRRDLAGARRRPGGHPDRHARRADQQRRAGANRRFPRAASGASLGEITLDFSDLDIRDAASQILGDILHVNYTVDPAVHGTATVHTAASMSRPQLLATLQSLLAANNATVVETAGLYRVLPAPGASGSLGAGSDANSAAVPLRYASAVELAKVLQPFLQNGGQVAANPGTNTLVVVGDPATREALIGLIRTFDVDSLAGQSYALFPVTAGDAQDTAAALQTAFRTQSGGALAGVVRVVPMQTISSVLVIASQHAYIEDARRVFALIERVRRQTVRSWRVYYLQNSRSNDVANVLQQAFTPGHVTAQQTPSEVGSTAPGSAHQPPGRRRHGRFRRRFRPGRPRLDGRRSRRRHLGAA